MPQTRELLASAGYSAGASKITNMNLMDASGTIAADFPVHVRSMMQSKNFGDIFIADTLRCHKIKACLRTLRANEEKVAQ